MNIRIQIEAKGFARIECRIVLPVVEMEFFDLDR